MTLLKCCLTLTGHLIEADDLRQIDSEDKASGKINIRRIDQVFEVRNSNQDAQIGELKNTEIGIIPESSLEQVLHTLVTCSR